MILRSVGFVVCLLLSSFIHAQINAVTDVGDEVILYSNGTWQYANDLAIEEESKADLTLNDITFEKGEDSSFLLKSAIVSLGVHLNPKEWSFEKAIYNDQAEYELKRKGKDVYGMLISEEIEIPLESLRSIVISNARNVISNVKLVSEEYRMVNGIKMLCMEFNGATEGINFTYFGYYYSNVSGTVQLITYTSENLMKIYKEDCEKLLNGLTEL